MTKPKASWIIAAAALGVVGVTQAGTDHTAAKGTTGSWFETSTWNTDTLVADGDNVYIAGGAAVAFDPSDAATTSIPGNVYLGTVQNDTTVAKLTISGGTLKTTQMRIANVYGTVGEVVQTGGTLETTSTGEGSLSVGYFDQAQKPDESAWSTYTLEDGTINVAGILYLGEWGRGVFNQKGGTVNVKSFFGLTRHAATNRGIYNLTGGTLNAATDGGNVNIGYPGAGIGVMNVSGADTLFYAPRGIYLYNTGSALNVSGGATVKAQFIAPNAGTTITFDGATLVATANNVNLIAGETGSLHVYVGDNGLTIDTGANTVYLWPGLEAAAGATKGDVVKKGSGTLIFCGENTFKGKLDIQEGNVIYNITSGVKTESHDINLLAGASFKKQGNGALKLTGKNSWTGKTYIYGGVLAAEIGQGIPSTSHIEIAGNGSWSPIGAEGAPTIGTGTGEFSFERWHGGFSAVDEAKSITVGNDPTRIFTLGAEGSSDQPGDFWLNGPGANALLTFNNPITLANNHYIKVYNGQTAVITNSVSPITAADYYLYLGNSGTLNLNGPMRQSTTGKRVFLGIQEGGTLNINATSETNYAGDIYQRSNGKVVVGPGATLDCSTWVYAGSGYKQGASSGTFTVDGGTLNMSKNGNIHVGYVNGSVSTLNLQNNGTINGGILHVGGEGGLGTFNQTSGSFTTTMAGYVGATSYNGAAGDNTYNLSGGTATFGNDLCVGWCSRGVVNVSGGATLTARNVYLTGSPQWSDLNHKNVTAALSVRNATLKTDAIRVGSVSGNVATVTFDGATLTPYSSGATLVNWLNGFGSDLTIGAGGLTLDTGDNTVFAGDLGLATYANGPVVKKGSGSLTLASLPTAAKIEVREGTVKLTGGSSTKDTLVHRWSFNGSLADSAGGQDATMARTNEVTYTEDGKAIALAGGDGATAPYVSLGADILPKTGSVTFEFWSTLHTHSLWEKALMIGDSNSDGILFTYTTGSGNSFTSFNFQNAGTGNQCTGYFDVDRPYYTAIRFVPVAEGGSIISVFTIDTQTKEMLGSYVIKSAKSIADVKQTEAGLGWSTWNNAIPNADYDEVRVWNTAFSEAEMLAHVALGPDELPSASDGYVADNTYPAAPSATLKANNYLTHRWDFNGTAKDSIGANDGTLNGGCSYTDGNTALCLTGNGKSSSAYVDLGKDVLPKSGPVTLELWTTYRGPQYNNQKLLYFGANKGHGLAYTQTGYKTTVSSIWAGGFSTINNQNMTADGTSGIQPTDVLCHIAIVINGKSFTAYLHRTDTDELIGKYACELAVSDLSTLNQTCCWIGRDIWGDISPNVNVAEMRVWNAALSETQLAVNRTLGPDVLPKLTADVPTALTVAEGATLDLGGTTLAQANLTGEGTIENGTLQLTGEIAPGGNGTVGTLTLASDTKITGTIRLDVGDLIVVNGTLDLTGATIVVNDPENLGKGSAAYTFAHAQCAGAKVIGKPATEKVGKFAVRVTERRATIGMSGFVLIIK